METVLKRNIPGGAPPREADVLRDSLEAITAHLPVGWSRRVRRDAPVGRFRADAIIDLEAPDGGDARLVIEAKPTVEARDVALLAEQVLARTGAVANAVPVIVARYLSPPVRERLEALGIGYADATGNVRIAIDRPALFVRDVGATSDPWRGPGRPRGALNGPTAARLVRALADFAPPYGAPTLAERSGASVGATYRMLDFLEREDLIARQPRGPITRVDWRAIIERQATDLGATATERLRLYLEPRGLPALVEKLAKVKRPRYVVTGTLAAERYAPLVPARLAVIYADAADDLAGALGLRESPNGNVLLGPPLDGVAFDREVTEGAVAFAAPSQVALDLLGGPGRAPAEAEALLNWMERKPDAWRN